MISIGEVSKISGQGMPSLRHHDFGNLFIQFEVVLPTMDEFIEDGRADKIAMLREILPEPRHLTPAPEEAMKEDFELETLSNVQQTRAQGGPSGMAMDDEDGQSGGERVQCAHQ